MGTPFASLIVSDPIPLPFDEGQWVKVRKLTGRQVDISQAEHLRGLIAGQSSRGWAATFTRTLVEGVSDAKVQALLRDPLNGYDRHTVAAFGLASWSYTNPDAGKDGDPSKPTAKQIEDLDDEAIEFIATEVMRLTKPYLFVTVEQANEEKKTGS